MRIYNQIYYAVLMLAVIAFPLAYRAQAADQGSAWICFGYAFAFLTPLVSIVFSGQSRFHFPAMVLLVINAAWFYCLLTQRMMRQPQPVGMSDPA